MMKQNMLFLAHERTVMQSAKSCISQTCPVPICQLKEGGAFGEEVQQLVTWAIVKG